jgi:sodium/hydrogen antiporter
MKIELWYLLIGGLFVLVTMAGTLIRRLPMTLTILYLAAGLALGPIGLGVAGIGAIDHANLLEHLSELAVIVSLFTAGLKLRCPILDARWAVPLRLAFLSMVLTVGLVALLGTQVLGLSLGAAVLLGGVLAPTDPVLASEVQLESAADRNRLRFGITGEAGLNDGTAFPFVLLGLGLLGVHELGSGGWRWFAVDVFWAVLGGLAIGGLLGTLAGHMVLYLRREHKEGAGHDEFLALGLIGLSYGAALMAHAYGFLAVFAAGLALRNIERRHSGEKPPAEVSELAAAGQPSEVSTDPETAPAYMAEAVLVFSERAERLLEVALVLLVGFMFKAEHLGWSTILSAAVLFLVIRPVAVFAGLAGSGVGWRDQSLFAWFGIRGIGSIYYLMYAIGQGLDPRTSQQLVGITLTVIALSILVHGVSVTPLMQFRARHRRRS